MCHQFFCVLKFWKQKTPHRGYNLVNFFLLCRKALQQKLCRRDFQYVDHLTGVLCGYTAIVFSTAWVQSMSSLCRTFSMLQLGSFYVSGSSTASPLMFEIDYVGYPFCRESNTKCVPWSTGVCIRRHRRISLNCAYRCLNQSIVVTSVLPRGATFSTTLQDNKIWPEKFCCCRSNFVELSPIVSSRPITNTISVLCTFENSFILQSIWNASLAPPWQFRL